VQIMRVWGCLCGSVGSYVAMLKRHLLAVICMQYF
jgi:hypothetical protein